MNVGLSMASGLRISSRNCSVSIFSFFFLVTIFTLLLGRCKRSGILQYFVLFSSEIDFTVEKVHWAHKHTELL